MLINTNVQIQKEQTLQNAIFVWKKEPQPAEVWKSSTTVIQHITLHKM